MVSQLPTSQQLLVGVGTSSFYEPFSGMHTKFVDLLRNAFSHLCLVYFGLIDSNGICNGQAASTQGSRVVSQTWREVNRIQAKPFRTCFRFVLSVEYSKGWDLNRGRSDDRSPDHDTSTYWLLKYRQHTLLVTDFGEQSDAQHQTLLKYRVP